MIKTAVLAIVTIAVSLSVYLYFHLGVYEPVTVTLEKRGPFELLFKQHHGPYHQINSVIHEVEVWAQEHHMQCSQTFGEYLDNPETVDEDRLRSQGGCVLTSPLAVTPPEFIYQKRGERSYAVGHFQGSPAIGPYKVYPKIRRFLDEHKLKSSSPVLELYTVSGNDMTTEYLFAIDPASMTPASN